MACGWLPRQGDPLGVLVVEANPHVRMLLRRALDQDGRFGPVEEAGDPGAALACPAGVGVVLINIDLAGLGSQGLIAALHKRDPSPAVVVLSLTGVPYLRYAAVVEGADDFLVRPEDLPWLADRIAQAATRRALRWPA
jgi:DNA-binding NarL/FixJ family response regulator